MSLHLVHQIRTTILHLGVFVPGYLLLYALFYHSTCWCWLALLYDYTTVYVWQHLLLPTVLHCCNSALFLCFFTTRSSTPRTSSTRRRLANMVRLGWLGLLTFLGIGRCGRGRDLASHHEGHDVGRFSGRPFSWKWSSSSCSVARHELSPASVHLAHCNRSWVSQSVSVLSENRFLIDSADKLSFSSLLPSLTNISLSPSLQIWRYEHQTRARNLINLFFDRPRSKQSIDETILLLSISPYSRQSLLVVGGIPVWVEHDEPIRTN